MTLFPIDGLTNILGAYGCRECAPWDYTPAIKFVFFYGKRIANFPKVATSRNLKENSHEIEGFFKDFSKFGLFAKAQKKALENKSEKRLLWGNTYRKRKLQI